MDGAEQKSPRNLLAEYAKTIEPRCSRCGSSINWYYSSGFGSDWMSADYGRCCGRLLDINGKEEIFHLAKLVDVEEHKKESEALNAAGCSIASLM